MIVLQDVIEAVSSSPLCEGWFVGGVVERVGQDKIGYFLGSGFSFGFFSFFAIRFNLS